MPNGSGAHGAPGTSTAGVLSIWAAPNAAPPAPVGNPELVVVAGGTTGVEVGGRPIGDSLSCLSASHLLSC